MTLITPQILKKIQVEWAPPVDEEEGGMANLNEQDDVREDPIVPVAEGEEEEDQ